MSSKPVPERLQVKYGRRLAVVGASPGLDRSVGALDARASVAKADVILLVVPNRACLQDQLPAVLNTAQPSAILWVAYPKLSSPLAADLSRDIIHTLVPDYGLDTVSQIAIDDVWSALRLKHLT